MADLKDPGYWDTAILRAAGRLMMLAAFESAPGHGYEIAQRLRTLCGNWCNPSPAMIYPAIHELEAHGLRSMLISAVETATEHSRTVTNKIMEKNQNTNE